MFYQVISRQNIIMCCRMRNSRAYQMAGALDSFTLRLI